MTSSDKWSYWISVLLVYNAVILAVQSHREAAELVGSLQPVVALVGDNVTLPCHREPAVSASDETVVWIKPGLYPKYIHVHPNGQSAKLYQNPSYNNRTSLFVDQLSDGNVSLRLLNVKPSDSGEYVCILKKTASIQLVVAAASTPVADVAEIDPNKGRVILQCNSTGWYPEPEVFWLDAEGNLLSAGPPETVRGPDDLYTVSSRVTVEKRHSNNFTCRVTQKKTNQTRETMIHVPADCFKVESGLYVTWIIIIVIILAVLMFIIIPKEKCFKKREADTNTFEAEPMLDENTQRLEPQPVRPVELKSEEAQLEEQPVQHEEEECAHHDKHLKGPKPLSLQHSSASDLQLSIMKKIQCHRSESGCSLMDITGNTNNGFTPPPDPAFQKTV